MRNSSSLCGHRKKHIHVCAVKSQKQNTIPTYARATTASASYFSLPMAGTGFTPPWLLKNPTKRKGSRQRETNSGRRKTSRTGGFTPRVTRMQEPSSHSLPMRENKTSQISRITGSECYIRKGHVNLLHAREKFTERHITTDDVMPPTSRCQYSRFRLIDKKGHADRKVLR